MVVKTNTGEDMIVEELINHPAFKEGESWKVVNFKKNEKIVEQGDVSRDLYLLQSGCVRVLGSVELDDNRKIQPGVCDMSEGDVFGELALFDQQPRSASIICVEDAEIVVIDGDKLMGFLEAHSDIGFKFMGDVMRLLVSRLRASNEKVYSLFAWGLKAHKIDDELV